MPRVRFEGQGEPPVELDVGYGSNLFRASLGRARLFNGPLRLLHCWGKGYCGACFVEVVEGADVLPERNAVERTKLRDAPERVRLACQLRVRGDLVVRKPRGLLRPRLSRDAREAAAAPEPAAP